jgi:undecaprenyl-phosphate glucose phosphotransferase
MEDLEGNRIVSQELSQSAGMPGRAEPLTIPLARRAGPGVCLEGLTPTDRWSAMKDTRDTEKREARAEGRAHRRGRVLIVGARRHCRRLAKYLGHGPWTSLPIVGFIDAGQPGPPRPLGRQLPFHPQVEPVPVLGGVDRLAEWVDRSKATHLVVALPGRRARRLRPQLADLSSAALNVHWVTDEVTRSAGSRTHRHPDGIIRQPRGPIRWGRIAKRLLDITGALVGLTLLAPLFLCVGVLILCTSGWPIFYQQERVGQGGRIFRMWKFRSMRKDAEDATGPVWAHDHDERCTRIGSWLRHTNIDELPQLFNVLMGEMSLVGPRPERPVFVERFRGSLPEYDLRHAMPMGMTGWAQVHGWRGRTSLRKRVQYDLDYIQRWSFWLDIQILFMTVEHVLYAKTSWTKRPPT